MSTSCGITMPNGIRVSVNFDGYPDVIIPTLDEIIARDGIEQTVKTLSTQCEWRFLDPSMDQTDSQRIMGYGEFYPMGRVVSEIGTDFEYAIAIEGVTQK